MRRLIDCSLGVRLCCVVVLLWVSLSWLGCARKAHDWGAKKSGVGQYRSGSSYRAPNQLAARPRTTHLGTVYGRTIVSSVQMVPFRRASLRPFQVLKLHYDGPSGVREMMRAASVSACCRPMSLYARRVRVWLTSQSSSRIIPGVRIHSRTFVVGRSGESYAIQIKNDSAYRYEAVVSVDGLDINDGRRASVRKRGYIVRPYGLLTLRGFRQSHNHVARFRFGTIAQSYAARTGQGRHIGVIGVALFQERTYRQAPDEPFRRLHSRPFASPGVSYSR